MGRAQPTHTLAEPAPQDRKDEGIQWRGEPGKEGGENGGARVEHGQTEGRAGLMVPACRGSEGWLVLCSGPTATSSSANTSYRAHLSHCCVTSGQPPEPLWPSLYPGRPITLPLPTHPPSVGGLREREGGAWRGPWALAHSHQERHEHHSFLKGLFRKQFKLQELDQRS